MKTSFKEKLDLFYSRMEEKEIIDAPIEYIVRFVEGELNRLEIG